MFVSGPPVPPPPSLITHPFCVPIWEGSCQTHPPTALRLCQQTLWHAAEVRAGLTCTLDTHIFIHACTHTGSAMLRQLASTYMEYKTGQAGRLTLWYKLCFARRSHCNWSAFQSLSFSGKNAIKADSICWISFCQTHGPALCFQLRNYQLCPENNNHFFSLPPASLGLSLSE